SAFFANGAHVGGFLRIPPGASPEAVANVSEDVAKKSSPDYWFKSLVLKDGFEWKPTTIEPNKANLVELDQAQERKVAQIYKLPPSKIGIKDSVSYNSLEQENRNYYDSTLTPWALRIAAQIQRKLLLPSERRRGLYVEHVIDSLQWADAQTRSVIAERGIRNGWLTPNEVRKWSNLPPIDGGDIARRDANPHPTNNPDDGEE
ncbi:MAG: phage portal protein, partial [Planctomycetota bacterium]